jgi:flagellar biosynthesis regulator FlaF
LSITTEPALGGAELDEGARMPALHPGEMLREEFMKPLGLSSNALAMELRVPVTRISEIVRERRTSICRRSSGCACKWISIWSLRQMRERAPFTREFDRERRASQ